MALTAVWHIENGLGTPQIFKFLIPKLLKDFNAVDQVRITIFFAKKLSPTLLKVNANLTNIYLLKVNNRKTGKRCEICSKLTIKTTKRRYLRRSDVFIVNFEQILHLFLVFL